MSYRRFRALHTVGASGSTTQRALADRLGLTEPSVSRMAAVLVDEGLPAADAAATGGNRRRLELTPAGEELVDRCRDALEGRLVALVESSGVPYEEHPRHTRQLLAALEPGVTGTAGRAS
ncbi:MarR family winged helix-turn-helix transcriptional regulator [Geodermatophilus maliterrae]|uniref:MarR family winged helix-turn-helix transcriptional regulator n=1 Tax=Geodermatophilus maliterrae TaxID=3162531 RepID=A0ABV3XC71_9ACTN